MFCFQKLREQQKMFCIIAQFLVGDTSFDNAWQAVDYNKGVFWRLTFSSNGFWKITLKVKFCNDIKLTDKTSFSKSKACRQNALENLENLQLMKRNYSNL